MCGLVPEVRRGKGGVVRTVKGVGEVRGQLQPDQKGVRLANVLYQVVVHS